MVWVVCWPSTRFGVQRAWISEEGCGLEPLGPTFASHFCRFSHSPSQHRQVAAIHSPLTQSQDVPKLPAMYPSTTSSPNSPQHSSQRPSNTPIRSTPHPLQSLIVSVRHIPLPSTRNRTIYYVSSPQGHTSRVGSFHLAQIFYHFVVGRRVFNSRDAVERRWSTTHETGLRFVTLSLRVEISNTPPSRFAV